MRLANSLNRLATRYYLWRHRIEWSGEMPVMDAVKPPKFLGKGKFILGSGVKFFTEQGPIIIRVDEHAVISIGDGTVVGGHNWIRASLKITIGKNGLLAPGVKIFDSDMHLVSPDRAGQPVPVVLEDNCWIAVNSTILKGVCIGKHSVVAAGSVVRKNIPAKTLYAGSPTHNSMDKFDCPDDWVRP